MALCERCEGRGYVRVTFPGMPNRPCPACGGLGHTSCCEGVGGDVLDMPTDPNERSER